ncbi:DUF5753 domain-containing protein [Amycolatopsis aidingensis]|uniref:DUF5753 domain-containing protein n=1 Tax=Amycolatopsis aidingensis TaxID=2842453 RepID=UPI001E2B0E36|nr:DUF5753 domain-containing protein [Amycolatopsis aidingensis]
MWTRTSPVLSRRRLGARLKRLRERRRMSVEEAAPKLDVSRATLHRIETGGGADVHFVRSAMDLYDSYEEDLLELARAGRRRGWWKIYDVHDQGYIGMETEAVEVCEFQLSHLPGLLQTESYMRTLFEANNARWTEAEVANNIIVRKRRQDRLTDAEAPLRLTAVLDEAVLRRPIGGVEVMREQLWYLLERAELPTVSLQVIPFGPLPHPGMDGTFIILRFAQDEDPDLLYQESVTGSVQTEKPRQLRAAKLAFDRLRSEALPPQESATFIAEVAAQL